MRLSADYSRYYIQNIYYRQLSVDDSEFTKYYYQFNKYDIKFTRYDNELIIQGIKFTTHGYELSKLKHDIKKMLSPKTEH